MSIMIQAKTFCLPLNHYAFFPAETGQKVADTRVL